MSLSANLFALLLCAAAPDGGDQPARGTEIVEEKMTLNELRQRLEELRNGQFGVIQDTRALVRELRLPAHQRTEVEGITASADAKQHEVGRAAMALLARVKAENTAVLVVEVLQQVHRDISTVQERFQTGAGAQTLDLQHEIIDTLKEMIDALKSR
jgi:hypothetical protein